MSHLLLRSGVCALLGVSSRLGCSAVCSAADGFQVSVVVDTLTADQTISLPDQSGVVVLSDGTRFSPAYVRSLWFFLSRVGLY